MNTLYCDAYLYACPNTDEGKTRFEQFIDGILLLQEIPSGNWLQACIDNHTLDLLYTENKIPIRPILEKALELYGNNELQAQDIIAVINKTIKHFPTLEKLTEAKDILYEDFKLSPSINTSHRGAPLNEAFTRFAILAAHHHSYNNNRQATPIELLTHTGDAIKYTNISATITCAEGPCDTLTPIHISNDANIITNTN